MGHACAIPFRPSTPTLPHKGGGRRRRRCRRVLRLVERPDRELAPRQRAALVAIEGCELAHAVGEDEGELLHALMAEVKGLHHRVRQRNAEPAQFDHLPQHLDPRPVAAPRSIVRIVERPRQHGMAGAADADDVDLRLRDAARHMQFEPEPRIGPFAGSGRRRDAADASRPRRDVARERRIAPDRPVEPVTARILRHPRLAGRRAGAGALGRIGAVGGKAGARSWQRERPVGLGDRSDIRHVGHRETDDRGGRRFIRP